MDRSSAREIWSVLIASLILCLAAAAHRLSPHASYQSLIVSQSTGDFGNLLQGRYMDSWSSNVWQWRNFTDVLGVDITGITVPSNFESITVAFMNRSGTVSPNGRSLSLLATGLFSCHYAVLFPSEQFMLYTDAGERIYKVNLVTKEQTVLLDNAGGSVGIRGLAYDSVNQWIYFSGAQLMRSRPDGTSLQNITRHLTLSYDHPGFQIALDPYTDASNPRVYLAFDGGLYMAAADGSTEQLIFSSPTASNYTGPYGVDIGIDPSDGQRYIYWCRGRRSKEAHLERSVLDADGRLTSIQSIWSDTTSVEAAWLYALSLVPWPFP